MKKLILITLSIITAFLFTACNSSGERPNQETTLVQSEEPLETTTVVAIEKTEKEIQYSNDSLALARLGDSLHLSKIGWGNITFTPSRLLYERKYQYAINFIRSDIRGVFDLDQTQLDHLVSVAMKDPEAIASIIDENSKIIKAILEFNGWSERVLTVYRNANFWLETPKKDLATDFEGFFKKYGHLESFPYYPGDSEKDSEAQTFWNDMDAIASKHSNFILDGKSGWIPIEYQNWLFVHRWKSRIGEANCKMLRDKVKSLIKENE